MNLNHDDLIRQLAANAGVFVALLDHTVDVLARWKPGERTWSILEIVNHLHDEEREDFRRRLRSVLADPAEPWPPIDPELWVVERDYASKDFRESVSNFLAERRQSIEWLNSLIRPAWSATHHHPQLGEMSAELILCNWVAHDFLHMRQIVRTRYHYLQSQAGPVSLNYAGTW